MLLEFPLSFLICRCRRGRPVSRGRIASRAQSRERCHTHAENISPDRVSNEYADFPWDSFLLTYLPRLDMTIHLVGFIGHVILKLELLQTARQVCEHPSFGQHDGKCCRQNPARPLMTHD